MTTLWVTLGIIAVNTLIAIVYLCIAAIKRDAVKIQNGIVMLLCPLVGILLYSCSWLVSRFLLSKNEMDYADITFSRTQRNPIQMPDFDEETQVVPLEEAFIASNDSDRRQALLNKLKKDYDNNIATILKGVENEDTETAHYAASVIMNVNSTFLNNIRELAYELEKNPGDYGINRVYTDYLLKYIMSDLLSPLERKKYVYLYLDLMRGIFSRQGDMLTVQDFKTMVDFYLEYRESSSALNWCDVCMQRFPDDEMAYLNRLKYYFVLQQPNEFNRVMNELKASSIFLSDRGLDIIRFFSTGISAAYAQPQAAQEPAQPQEAPVAPYEAPAEELPGEAPVLPLVAAAQEEPAALYEPKLPVAETVYTQPVVVPEEVEYTDLAAILLRDAERRDEARPAAFAANRREVNDAYLTGVLEGTLPFRPHVRGERREDDFTSHMRKWALLYKRENEGGGTKHN